MSPSHAQRQIYRLPPLSGATCNSNEQFVKATLGVLIQGTMILIKCSRLAEIVRLPSRHGTSRSTFPSRGVFTTYGARDESKSNAETVWPSKSRLRFCNSV